MLTPATYKTLDWIEDVSCALFLYDSGDNTPERAAVKFKNMLNLYHADHSASPADAFITAERTSPFQSSFRNSHEEDQNTAYRYSIDSSSLTHNLILTAETVQRKWWRRKPLVRSFFQGAIEEFIQRYSFPLSFTTGLYKIQDKGGMGFYAARGNNPCEASYRLALMNGLHRLGKRTYADAFKQANRDARSYPYSSSCESCADYLYILEPSPDEEGEEDLILSAYGDGYARRLFFKGCFEEFILIFGKN